MAYDEGVCGELKQHLAGNPELLSALLDFQAWQTGSQMNKTAEQMFLYGRNAINAGIRTLMAFDIGAVVQNIFLAGLAGYNSQ